MGLFNKKNKDDKKVDDKSTVKDQASTEVKKADVKEDKKPTAKTTDTVKKTSKKANTKPVSRAHRILIRPVISEKATIGTSLNKYAFEISAKANKVEVKKAIEEIYGVVPTSINILNQRGKNVRFGRRFGRTNDVKKAIVTLKKGDSIKLYEGI